MLLFKNMIFNKYTLICITSPKVKIHLSGQDEIELTKDTLFLIGKKSKIIGLSNNISNNDVFSIDDEDIECIIRLLPTHEVDYNNKTPPLIVGPRLMKEEMLAFQRLKENSSKFRRISILLFIFSRMDIGILANFLRSSKPIFLTSEKISSIVERDLSRSWKMKDIVTALHTSESSLRRKLKEEDYTYTQIVLDTKMRNALRLIDSSSGNIGIISSLLGYKSEAYFIAVFKKYFNITPKQFYLQNRRRSSTCYMSKHI